MTLCHKHSLTDTVDDPPMPLLFAISVYTDPASNSEHLHCFVCRFLLSSLHSGKLQRQEVNAVPQELTSIHD